MEVKGNKNTLNTRTKKVLFNFTTSTPLSVKTIVNQFKTFGIVFRGRISSFLRQDKFLGSSTSIIITFKTHEKKATQEKRLSFSPRYS